MRGHVLLFLLVIGAALCSGAEIHRFKRLTTFGKAPEKNNHQIGKAKDCKADSECVVAYSSCIADKDGKKRCICEDGAYPVNGVCERIRAVQLRQPCHSNSECIEGAECRRNLNATNPADQKVKVCLCSEDTVEEDGECSGCVNLQSSGWLIVLLGFASLMAIKH